MGQVANLPLIGRLATCPTVLSASPYVRDRSTPHVRDVYDLSVTLLDDGGAALAYWPSVDVLPAAFLPADAVHGVIGRDLLATAVPHFDGTAENSATSPSAIVGCVRTMSRSAV